MHNIIYNITYDHVNKRHDTICDLFILMVSSLHALVHCPCHPFGYHSSKHTVFIVWFLVFLEYQGSLECQVHQVGLEENAGREMITKVKMFVVVKNVLGTSDKKPLLKAVECAISENRSPTC